MTKEIEEFFNSLAPKWDDRCKKNDLLNVKNILLSTPLKEGDKVIDIACGTGIITGIIEEITHNEVCGIDISKGMIDIAKKKYYNNKNIIFYNEDIYKFNKKKYDFAVIYDAYPHFLELNELKKAIYNLLNDGGYFLILSDCSLEKLKVHHKGIYHISRYIESMEDEANFYKDKFEILKVENDDNGFLILAKKLS